MGLSQEHVQPSEETLDLIQVVELLLAHATTLTSMLLALRGCTRLESSRVSPHLIKRCLEEISKLTEVGTRL